MPSDTEQAPEGFTEHLRKSPLTDPWQPLFSRLEGVSVIVAVRVRQPHCNGKGFLHGGLISALADNAMGLSVIEAVRQQNMERGRSGSTVSLALDFLASGQMGQWVEFVPRVLKVGKGLAFADCTVVADSQLIARGNATYRFYETSSIDSG
jgi:uncharacterized protein (TIGR00369 family)